MTALSRMERFDDLFPEFFRRLARPLALSEDIPGDIKVDITENDKEYQVRAQIPGAKKDDIRVTVEGNFVSIAAEVKKEKEASRGFSLAHEIDDKAVVAKLENGVLTLTLPKREGTGAHKIAIQ
jgi:HSP20 family protein